ncbi:MAG TPA: CHAD domain-containing protein [Usitatibacter sp.]|nr:CHAD domain-containing protein [Usitatibacter sp.]
MREVELKLEVAAEDLDALARAPLLRAAPPPRRERLQATYFDTAGHLLRRSGMALRVRREGERWVQCLKAGHSGEAGLHSRDEWESPRADASLDLDLLAGTPLAPVLEDGNPDHVLRALFTVEIERTTWSVAVSAQDRVEVVADHGEVRHGRQRSPVCEVEIESVTGDPMAVFAAAEALLGVVPLRASSITKAQRGYALAMREQPRPAKAAAVPLLRDDRVDVAARRVVGAALAQLQANATHAARGGEWLHQFRVGLRRLRSALRIFRGCFERHLGRDMRADCRWLSRITGEARDLDVFIEAMLAPSDRGSALERRAKRARAAARRAVAIALASERYTRFVLRFARWLAMQDDSMDGDDIMATAAGALDRKYDRAMQGLRNLERLDAAGRHRVRIELKRLRYACEMLGSLYGRETVTPYAEAVAQLQDDLGIEADAMAALRLLEQLGGDGPSQATARRRWRDRARRALASAHLHIAAVRDAPRFWHAVAVRA